MRALEDISVTEIAIITCAISLLAFWLWICREAEKHRRALKKIDNGALARSMRKKDLP